MNTDAQRVLTAALNLPDEDRFEVVEALIGSFQAPELRLFDESWRKVIGRRSAELKVGSVTTIPWSEVKKQAREASGG